MVLDTSTTEASAEEEAAGPPNTMRVICPDGVRAGDALYVQTPEGHEITTVVPEGVEPGMEFDIDLNLDPEPEEQEQEQEQEQELKLELEQEPEGGHVAPEDAGANAPCLDSKRDVDADGDGGGGSEAIDRSELAVWMEELTASMGELGSRLDALDEMFTSSGVVVDSRISELSTLLATAAIQRAEAEAEAEAETEASAQQRSDTVEEVMRSVELLNVEVQQVKSTQEAATDATTSGGLIDRSELTQWMAAQEASMAGLRELLNDSVATQGKEREKISATVEESVGALDDRLGSCTAALESRIGDVVRDVESLRGVAQSVTDLWTQRSEAMSMAKEQTEAMQAGMETLRAEFEAEMQGQQETSPEASGKQMIDSAFVEEVMSSMELLRVEVEQVKQAGQSNQEAATDDTTSGGSIDGSELTQWMTTTTASVTAVENALQGSVVTLEREFEQFGQVLAELSEWTTAHMTSEKTRLTEIDGRVRELSEALKPQQQEETSSGSSSNSGSGSGGVEDGSVLESLQPLAEVTEPAEPAEAPRTIAEEYKTELEALLARWDDGRILTIVDSRIESQMSTLESQLGILMQNADASFLY
eukprot:COSAG06_NODE_1976_length_7906_cov_6.043395_6_plen_591_part_00